MTAHDTDALWSLARGSLATDEAARVQAHVAGCAECARLLGEMRLAVSALATHAAPALDDEHFGHLDARVLAGAERALAPGAALARGLVWASLGGVLAVAAAWFLIHVRSLEAPHALPVAREIAAAPREAAPAVVAAEPGEPAPAERGELRSGGLTRSIGTGEVVATRRDEAQLALRKARALVLADSRLELAELSAQRTRLALELGAVVIAAAPDQPGELAVGAGELEVVVLGTEFMVRRESSGAVHVAVREGRVRARAANEEHVLVAGQAATWRDGRLTLRAPSRPEARALERAGSEPRSAVPLARPEPPAPLPSEQPLPAPPPEPPAAPPADEPAPSAPAVQPPKPAPPSDVPQVMRKHRPGILLPRPVQTGPR